MGVYISQNEKGELSIQPDSYQKDFKLTQWVSNTLNAQLKYEAAQAESQGREVKKGMLTRPDGTVVHDQGEVKKALADSAQTWTDRSRQAGIDPDLRQWLLAKAADARAALDELEGRPAPEPVARESRPVSFSLPR